MDLPCNECNKDIDYFSLPIVTMLSGYKNKMVHLTCLRCYECGGPSRPRAPLPVSSSPSQVIHDACLSSSCDIHSKRGIVNYVCCTSISSKEPIILQALPTTRRKKQKQ